MVKQVSDNEIHLLIKYMKSVLWRVVKCLSYIEEVRCLKVKAFTVNKCIKILLGDQEHQNQITNNALTPSTTTETAHLRNIGF